MHINVYYPDAESERKIILQTTGAHDVQAECVMTPGDIQAAQMLIRKMPVGEKIVDAILELVRSARPDADAPSEIRSHISWGPGPRASQALMLSVRARALLQERVTPSLDDVLALAPPVLRHRMALTFTARAEGIHVEDVILDLLTPFA
jgi:MoxR-like ATPase